MRLFYELHNLAIHYMLSVRRRGEGWSVSIPLYQARAEAEFFRRLGHPVRRRVLECLGELREAQATAR